MHVVHVDLVFHRVISPVIRGAVGHAAFDAPSGHPHAEGVRIVITPVVALGGGGAAKLAAPPNERVLEQSPLLQVGQQSGDRSVNFHRVLGVIGLEIAVLVPFVTVRDLNEPHAPFGTASGDQALPAEVIRRIFIDAVEFEGRRAFLGKIDQLRRLGLHPKSEFERVDSPLQGGVGGVFLQMILVHLLQHVQLDSLQVDVGFRIFDVLDGGVFGLNAGVADRRPLKVGRQEGAAPVLHAAMAERRANGDESRQVLILRAQAVGHPGTDAGTDERVAAGVQLQQGASVGRVVGMDGANHAQIIGPRTDVREQVADGQAALTVLLELPGRLQQVARAGELHPRFLAGKRLAVVPLQRRLGIKRVHLRRAAVHEQEDDPLGLRLEVRRSHRQGSAVAFIAPGLRTQQSPQRQQAEPVGGLPQHVAAGLAGQNSIAKHELSPVTDRSVLQIQGMNTNSFDANRT